MIIYHSTQKLFKMSFFMLIVLSLLVVFLNFSFILIFKGALGQIMFTISYFMNNFKHLLLLSGE